MHTGLSWRNLREGGHLGDSGLDGRIILRWIFREVGCRSMDWVDLAQDKDMWWALVNAVIIFMVQ